MAEEALSSGAPEGVLMHALQYEVLQLKAEHPLLWYWHWITQHLRSNQTPVRALHAPHCDQSVLCNFIVALVHMSYVHWDLRTRPMHCESTMTKCIV